MGVKNNRAVRASARPLSATTTVASAVAGILWGAGGVAWGQAVAWVGYRCRRRWSPLRLKG